MSGSDGKKKPAWDAGDQGSIPGLGRFPGEGNSNPLQYSCLENFMDRGAWHATVHGVCKELATTEQLTLSFHSQQGWEDTVKLTLTRMSNLIALTSLVAQTVKRLPTMWETQVQSLGQEDLLEKEMATHSSILAWKIPWTEEPGRLTNKQTNKQQTNSPWDHKESDTTERLRFHLS